jgi:hypothetical protein
MITLPCIRGIAASAAVVLVTGLAPAASLAAQTLPAGTQLNAVMRNALDTKSAYTGQPISLSVVSPVPRNATTVEGAVIYGHVSHVRSAGQGRNPELEVVLDKIAFRNVQSQPLSANIANITEKKDQSPLVKGAAGALGGMLLGNWLGKALFGAKGGGLVGAAAGYLLASNNKSNFHVPSGSAATVHLAGDLRIP